MCAITSATIDANKCPGCEASGAALQGGVVDIKDILGNAIGKHEAVAAVLHLGEVSHFASVERQADKLASCHLPAGRTPSEIFATKKAVLSFAICSNMLHLLRGRPSNVSCPKLCLHAQPKQRCCHTGNFAEM